MFAPYELKFRPIDDNERKAFEAALHGFVALEAGKPSEEASSVFARKDGSSGSILLGFDTLAALEAFLRHCRGRIERLAELSVAAAHTNGS